MHVFQRSASRRLEALGITVHQGDLRNEQDVREALIGVQAVFHNAAKVGVWGHYEDYHAINVAGTQNVLDASRDAGVERLVFTSSASVAFDGTPKDGVDESAPLPAEPLTPYTATKAEAERLVQAAAGNELATVVLRPHLIWGPGDPHFVASVLLSVRQGRMAIIGEGRNKIDTTYVENAVAAHLLAADKLGPGAACNGNVYFITDGEPRPVRKVLNELLIAADHAPVARTVSERTAFRVAAIAERIHRRFKLPGEPAITRFVVQELSQTHWFDMSAARRDLGYAPPVTVQEGLQRLQASFFPDWPTDGSSAPS